MIFPKDCPFPLNLFHYFQPSSADSSGYYGIALLQGSYLVNVTDASGDSFGLPSLDYTQSISIEKGHVIEMDFSIDTGIR
ncbi:MAG: hypothetical protein WCT52_01725 [Candidatus Micrarchaeia archaeon]